MKYSATEKKRFRRSFSEHSHSADIPSLLSLQRRSYRDFLQKDAAPDKRRLFGLQEAFRSVFPIVSSSGHISLEFDSYELDAEPLYDVRECMESGQTYRTKVHANIRMVIRDKKGGGVSAIKKEKVYMGDLPLMTEQGSFVVNGTERVVVSQLHRSPGVLFEHDAGRGTQSNKRLYGARIIPYNGRWLDFEFDQKDFVYFRIDRRRKMPATLMLKAIGYSVEEILAEFFDFDKFKLVKGRWQYSLKNALDNGFLEKESLPFALREGGKEDGAVVVDAGHRIKRADIRQIKEKLATKNSGWYPVGDEFLRGDGKEERGKRLATDVVSADGEVIARANAELDKETMERIRDAGVEELQTIHTNELNRGAYVSNTLVLDGNRGREASRNEIYKMLRPGDPPSPDVVNTYLDGIFFSHTMYDMSRVGRMKFNRRLEAEPGERPQMQYRIAVTKAELTKAVIPAAAENIFRAVQELDCAGNADKEKAKAFFVGAQSAQAAQALLNYIAHSESRGATDKLDGGEVEMRARAVFFFSFLAENMSREEADALSAKLDKVPHEVLEQTILTRRDIMEVARRLVDLRNGVGAADDIDSMINRRVRTVGEFTANQFEQGLRRVERAIRDRLSRAENEGLMPHELISAKAISASVMEFFNGNQLSQFMDQTNPLSEITHKRRVSAFGTGGLTRDRVGFEVRDVHPTHYGRICPIETPEGQNIGLINSMALYSDVDEYGFLQTRYRAVEGGKVVGEAMLVSAIREEGKNIAPAGTPRDKNGKLTGATVLVRRDGEYYTVKAGEVHYIDVSPAQISSAAASMIPFLEHDDANRALMGSNMQRQAVPCLAPEKPLVGTGVERRLAADSGAAVCAGRAGEVVYVDADRIVVSVSDDESGGGEMDVDIYPLVKHVRTNQNTGVNQRPIVKQGDKIGAGDVLADGAATDLGELALGQNLLAAFMPWNGFNFEDSILISEKVIADQRFCSVHIIEEVAHARVNPLGNEEITRDIPHQSERALRHLDEEGIVQIGVEVNPGDILVGKVTPKGERQLSPEEKLLQAVFGDKANDFKDTSLRMPPGSAGVVIDVKVFTNEENKGAKKKTDFRDAATFSQRAEDIKRDEIRRFENACKEELGFVEQDAARRIFALAGKDAGKDGKAPRPEEAFKLRVKDAAVNAEIAKIVKKIDDFKNKQKKRIRDTKKKLREGPPLQKGIKKTVKVYIAIKRNLQAGDKMAGRHGNKGVVSKIEAVESMPYLADGTPVDIVLNPLGVPSRMNVGQVLETHLGFAAMGLGNKLQALLEAERKKQIPEVRAFLQKIYAGDLTCNVADLSDDEAVEMARNLARGVPFATPIFDGASEDEIRRMLKLAGLPESGQATLYDGRSGEPFSRPVTVGCMYIMKLHHLVDEKMHSRSTGPYSLITQQPLGGKAQRGGQRFGEMEVWALEAYGAAYTLREILTIKSDDTEWRSKMFEDIAGGDYQLKSDTPESFNVLKQELRAMCIDLKEQV